MDRLRYAWATTNRLVLGQVATDAHANALTAIPTLLATLVLEGRTETRPCVLGDDPAVIEPDGRWAGLRSITMVTAARRIGDTVRCEPRSVLSSLPGDARQVARAVRGHGGIENRLPWVLAITFRKNASRVRTGHAVANVAVLRHLALTLLRRETTATGGGKAKRLQAGWNAAYLLTVLAGEVEPYAIALPSTHVNNT